MCSAILYHLPRARCWQISKWMKAYKLTSGRLTVYLGEIRHIDEQVQHRDKLHPVLWVKRYWPSVGGEIASCWGNQRKACNISKRGLGMLGASGPLLSHCEPAVSLPRDAFHFSPQSVMVKRYIPFEPHPWSASLLSFLLPSILTPHHTRWFLKHSCS